MATSFDSTIANLGISSTANTAANGATSKSTSLGQADFLKLMTAQMKNQDPFDPVDNTQMVAQMAQFSSLAGITEMGSTLKAIADKLGATSMQDAVSYVGRTVLTAGNTAYGRSAGGIAGAIELGAEASNVTVSIADANGQVLHTADLGAQKAGTIGYEWDGKKADGTDAGTGPFTVTINAADGASNVPATGLVWAPVTSVSTTSGSPVLTLPGIGEVPASAVRQIG
ncbi:flagellar hook assembly protein FlgD [Sphingomonas radiodurans]|uniref:flagellar hook assembly protein FlgD n=1 Tax=Sphingomonas radiodurans TaxID=2890321 RepID=UPI001E5BA31A|nr:flagellar hook capping FlgD N-terminal domain-containing protein [Sphingomonas radiodurans]WBH15651.1 flagellar hook assembly protein FlgD [Sphingomonas radiodurans]